MVDASHLGASDSELPELEVKFGPCGEEGEEGGLAVVSDEVVSHTACDSRRER